MTESTDNTPDFTYEDLDKRIKTSIESLQNQNINLTGITDMITNFESTISKIIDDITNLTQDSSIFDKDIPDLIEAYSNDLKELYSRLSKLIKDISDNITSNKNITSSNVENIQTRINTAIASFNEAFQKFKEFKRQTTKSQADVQNMLNNSRKRRRTEESAENATINVTEEEAADMEDMEDILNIENNASSSSTPAANMDIFSLDGAIKELETYQSLLKGFSNQNSLSKISNMETVVNLIKKVRIIQKATTQVLNEITQQSLDATEANKLKTENDESINDILSFIAKKFVNIPVNNITVTDEEVSAFKKNKIGTRMLQKRGLKKRASKASTSRRGGRRSRHYNKYHTRSRSHSKRRSRSRSSLSKILRHLARRSISRRAHSRRHSRCCSRRRYVNFYDPKYYYDPRYYWFY